MSSPRSSSSNSSIGIVGTVAVREGTRVILREITANLHNSSAVQSPRKKGGGNGGNGGNEAATIKGGEQEHDVKVRFVREFADASATTVVRNEGTAESNSVLSSASSFTSLTSTLDSSKCCSISSSSSSTTTTSSGICVDNAYRSLDNKRPGADTSYVDSEIPGLDDLISACENIRLGDESVDRLPKVNGSSGLVRLCDDKDDDDDDNLSGDQTFASATDGINLSRQNSPVNFVVAPLETSESVPSVIPDLGCEISDPVNDDVDLALAVPIFPRDNSKLVSSLDETFLPCQSFVEQKNSIIVDKVSTLLLTTTTSLSEKFAQAVANDISGENSISGIKEPTFFNAQKLDDNSVNSDRCKSIDEPEDSSHRDNNDEIYKFVEEKVIESVREISNITSVTNEEPPAVIVGADAEVEYSIDEQHLNDTVTVQQQDQDVGEENIFLISETDRFKVGIEPDHDEDDDDRPLIPNESSDNLADETICLPDEYTAFVPQKQSTSLTTDLVSSAAEAVSSLKKLERQATPYVTANFEAETVQVDDDRCNFDKLELAANSVANDIYNTSLQLVEENANFVSATSELFRDPTNFDFLLSKTPRKNKLRDLRTESLYVKFDPLVSNASMLPQGNDPSPPSNENRNGEDNPSIVDIGTPKQNPAIAAIDKLLFYSPMTTAATTNVKAATVQKSPSDSQEKLEEPPNSTEETTAETVDMAKELQLERSTVLELKKELGKLKMEQAEKESGYQEKINQLQTQLSQEIKNKNQITVVVDEYEKSISRLVAERERDRKNLDLEKAKLQEELQATKHHLDNTEAAFNDVHLKYERLKVVVATYKSNESALKESLEENVEIIKALENRYEQVKSHATARLEKANQDLEAIRTQNESETVRLHAMIRKAELKSNSLAELVEQKTKECKELAQILDELIARVGRNKSE